MLICPVESSPKLKKRKIVESDEEDANDAPTELGEFRLPLSHFC